MLDFPAEIPYSHFYFPDGKLFIPHARTPLFPDDFLLFPTPIDSLYSFRIALLWLPMDFV